MSFEENLRAIIREELRAALGATQSAQWQGLVTLADAGKLASVSVSTLEKWGRQGLRIHRKGRVRRIDVAELRAFMAQRESVKSPEPEQRARDILAEVMPMRRIR